MSVRLVESAKRVPPDAAALPRTWDLGQMEPKLHMEGRALPRCPGTAAVFDSFYMALYGRVDCTDIRTVSTRLGFL